MAHVHHGCLRNIRWQTPPDFLLTGIFTSNDFEWLQLIVSKCDQTQESWVKGLNCVFEAEITNSFSTSEVKINMYFSSTLINLLDYHNPNKVYLDAMYWVIDSSVVAVSDLFYDELIVQDYDSYFQASAAHNRSFYSAQSSSMQK